MRYLGTALVALAVAASAGSAAQGATLFLGAYPNSLLVVDEDKGAIVQRIPLASGLPVSMRLSHDKKRIYVVTNTRSGVEVIDVATRKVISHLTLNTPVTRYRFNGGAPDPTGRYFYTLLTQIDKKNDHYEVSKPKYAVIDLEEKKIVRSQEVDPEDENAFRLIELPVRRVHFAIDPVRTRFAYVFTEDGRLHQINILSGKIANSVAVTEPYSMDGHWNDPRPRIAVAGDEIMITDPLKGLIHALDAETLEKKREVVTGGAPYEIVAVGGSGAVHE